MWSAVPWHRCLPRGLARACSTHTRKARISSHLSNDQLHRLLLRPWSTPGLAPAANSGSPSKLRAIKLPHPTAIATSRIESRLVWSAAACRRCLPRGLARACSTHEPKAMLLDAGSESTLGHCGGGRAGIHPRQKTVSAANVPLRSFTRGMSCFQLAQLLSSAALRHPPSRCDTMLPEVLGRKTI